MSVQQARLNDENVSRLLFMTEFSIPDRTILHFSNATTTRALIKINTSCLIKAFVIFEG